MVSKFLFLGLAVLYRIGEAVDFSAPVGRFSECCNGGEPVPVGVGGVPLFPFFPVMGVSCDSQHHETTSRKLGEFQLVSKNEENSSEAPKPNIPLYLSNELHQIVFGSDPGGADAAAAADLPGGPAAAGAPPAPKPTGPTRFFLRKWFLGFTAGVTLGQLAPMYGRAEFQNKQLDQSIVVWVKSGAFFPEWQAGKMGRGTLQLGFVHLTRTIDEGYGSFLGRIRQSIENVEHAFRHRSKSVEAMRDLASLVKRNPERTSAEVLLLDRSQIF